MCPRATHETPILTEQIGGLFAIFLPDSYFAQIIFEIVNKCSNLHIVVIQNIYNRYYESMEFFPRIFILDLWTFAQNFLLILCGFACNIHGSILHTILIIYLIYHRKQILNMHTSYISSFQHIGGEALREPK